MRETLPPPMVSIQRVHEIGALGNYSEIPAALSAVPTGRRLSDPCAIALRAIQDIAGGDAPGGAALLKRAIDHTDATTRQYLIDLYVPLLLTRGDFDEADRTLNSVESVVPELQAPFMAMRSQIAACRGRDVESRSLMDSALSLSRTSDAEPFVARVLARAAFAAFYREDFGEAQERALEAARLFEALGANRNAAHAYSILYVVANDWLGNPEVARFYAQRLAMRARLAGDVGLENNGVVAQLEIAAESGDAKRVSSLRSRLMANPLHEQYHEKLPFVLGEALFAGWSGNFDHARALLLSIRSSENRRLPERALCDSMLAVCSLAEWQVEESRRHARLAISETAHRGEHEPLYDSRRRRIARIIASAACVAIGDPSRARRALTRAFDPEHRFAGLLSTNGITEDEVPPMMRGYARFVNAACEAAKRRRPQLGLTAAELAVLRALPDGMTVAALASAFGKSPKTIEAQVSSIYAKLGVSNRAQAIQRARDLGVYA